MIPAAVLIISVLSFLLVYIVGQAAQNFDNAGGSGEQPEYPGVAAFAKAISQAEGFGVPGAIPTMAHNPGDLKIPNWGGGYLGSGVSVFGSDSEGWSRLYHQLNLIADGNSQVYNDGMNILEMAQKWTATNPNDWANNVANSLTAQGFPATPNSLLYEILGG